MMRMKKDPAAIQKRLAIVLEDIDTMRRKAAYIGNTGGPNPAFAHVEFHEGRAHLLRWMLEASTDRIVARLRDIEAALGPAIALKDGPVTNLPAEIATQIAHLALLEYGLGVHPHQLKRVARHV